MKYTANNWAKELEDFEKELLEECRKSGPIDEKWLRGGIKDTELGLLLEKTNRV